MDKDLIPNKEDPEFDEGQPERRASKKDQIISLFTSGMGSVEDLAMITGSRPSYVASVLQAAGLMSGYFDLYTTTSHPMNVYSRFFAGKLGYKDEATARQSVARSRCSRSRCRPRFISTPDRLPLFTPASMSRP